MKVFKVNGNLFEDCVFNRMLVANAKAEERAKVLDEVTKEIEFEEKWLSDAIREDKGNDGYNIDIAFSGIKNRLCRLKEQK